jgi:hypothetical protein
MKRKSVNRVRAAGRCAVLSLFAVSGLALAQEMPDAQPPAATEQPSAPTNGGWRRVGEPVQSQAPDSDTQTQAYPQSQNQAPYPPQSQNQASYPPQNQSPYPSQAPYPNQGPYPNQRPYPNQQAGPANEPNAPIPAQLTIRAGTLITVRLDQGLSSDRNQPGDAFTASLVNPIVVDGVVVAERGQTVSGRVVEAKKAGLGEGVSRLKIELTDLTLSDGQPVPIKTLLISQRGPTSPPGRDAAIIGGTTVTGAAIGAAAGWGTGAAIGAGAGAMAGVVGVLLTRGHPTVLYPESVLTFRIDAPVIISTTQAPQAFRYVSPNDYDQPYPMQGQMQPPPAASPCGPYGCPPPAPYYYGYSPYGYSPYYYPYYYGYGPGFGFLWGPSFYFGGGFGGYGGFGRGGFGGGFGRGGFGGGGFGRGGRR